MIRDYPSLYNNQYLVQMMTATRTTIIITAIPQSTTPPVREAGLTGFASLERMTSHDGIT